MKKTKPEAVKVKEVKPGNVIKRTISVPVEVWTAAVKRAKAMNPPYKSISGYISFLMWHDITYPKPHTREPEAVQPPTLVSGDTAQFAKTRTHHTKQTGAI